MTTNLVTSKTARHLAKSVQAVSYAILGDLQAGNDMAASFLWAKGELERLAEEAESAAGEVLLLEQNRSGEG